MLPNRKLNALIVIGAVVLCMHAMLDLCAAKPFDIYDELVGDDDKILLRMADLIDSIDSEATADDSNNSASNELKDMQPSERCMQPMRKGVCRALIPRYTYDPKAKDCKEFKFGGCDGNGNNFTSRKQCMETCKGF